MRRIALGALMCLAAMGADADTAYRLPPKAIVDAFDAPPTPEAVVGPTRSAVLFVEAEAYPPIAQLARPMLRLAGLRILPTATSRQHTRRFTEIRVQALDGSTARRVDLPADARIGLPVWSNDGKRFAFTRELDDGLELWIADAASATARPVAGVRVTDVLGRAFEWLPDGRLLARAVPAQRGPAPAPPHVPTGPTVQETAGKLSQMATFEDLLKNASDEELFAYYASAQLARIDPTTGASEPWGQAGWILSAEPSPDGRWLLVSRLKRPFSYRVPYFYFARTIEVWDAAGRSVATVADLPVSDEVPRQGVPTGPRNVEWQPLLSASLVWTEAQDGGNPLTKVPHRDALMRLQVPFTAPPEKAFEIRHRLVARAWTARKDEVLLTEHDRDRRWRTTSLVRLSPGGAIPKVLFDLSAQDDYNDPGAPVLDVRPDGERVLLQDGDWAYFAGEGATESGSRPFLDRRNLATGKTERMFRCDETRFERFVSFVGPSKTRILIRSESPADPPNFFVADLPSGKRVPVTAWKDVAPQIARISKQLLKYPRRDGVMLSGTLYLPPDYKPGTRLPVLIWAYPLEYSDAGTAGQVRGSTRTFTRLLGPSPLFFALHGYAVLNDATMPVVGDPETVNNTYVEQISDDARAAIEKLEAMGVADPKRVCIAGHSYGAFMTANLLAHTDLFAAGIARSGAYNRSLTPFGFQTERRSYWEATDLYTKISPFTYANRIRRPILLIHGEADDNSGTFPVQSERLFEAIRGNGGTARLVLLPNEAHGYRARESVLHTIAEMLDWADRYVKNGGGAATAAR